MNLADHVIRKNHGTKKQMDETYKIEAAAAEGTVLEREAVAAKSEKYKEAKAVK